ncbi:MAG: transporter substrate-binding domain-containing protein [Rickettsiales bacterium]|nr:MAG: transporter substrate-binding domain-containing protein [Rickettsiales bacterium]
MKKLLLCLSLLVMILVSCKKEEVKSVAKADRKIIIGTNATYAPYEYLDEDGKIVGAEIDLLKAILEKAGYANYEVIDMDFEGLILALTEKKIDIIVSSMAASDARKEKISFSDTYFDDPESGVATFVRESNTDINGIDDLQDKIVGGETGTFAWGVLEKWKAEGKVKEIVGFSGAQLMDALFNNKIDALFTAIESPKYFIKVNKDPAKNLKMVGEIVKTPGTAFGVRKDDTQFLNDVNSAYGELRENGEYKQIWEKLQKEVENTKE